MPEAVADPDYKRIYSRANNIISGCDAKTDTKTETKYISLCDSCKKHNHKSHYCKQDLSDTRRTIQLICYKYDPE